VNPLRRGAMGPYADTTRPKVFRFTTELDGQPVAPAAGDPFTLVVEPGDETPLAVPRPWHDLPVMPAIVRWRILDARGHAKTGWRTSVDFRETIPSASEFDRIWAVGVTQNHVRDPGRYRLALTRRGELSSLQPGLYVVEIGVADTGGTAKRARFITAVSAAWADTQSRWRAVGRRLPAGWRPVRPCRS